ncbi:hypothetical protein DPMN_051729 [Dreissena polymorpha]|uniref:Uncharacterized protein n=1 Tax=Dreissena polymorpha TaxID=45954 RepID=A0A9D4HP61_DREPO|nr:hypothetical protein DPMN_051729 [Dreissena polymorpha]
MDLKSDQVQNLLAAFASIYVSVTGPYWEVVTSGNVPYVQLYRYIQNVEAFLQKCIETPSILLNGKPDWCGQEYYVPIKPRLADALKSVVRNEAILVPAIKTSCEAMIKTICKQLADFLTGVFFGEKPDDQTLSQTKFAHVTNLACEHHFGDLDSSQKRRPNASLHHHLSVQMLKRSRIKLKDWYNALPEEKKASLWKAAHKGGKTYAR